MSRVQSTPATKRLALVIEDELSVMLYVEQYLRGKFEVLQCISLKRAWEYLRHPQATMPDVIILDLGLPDSEAPDTVRTIPGLVDYAPVVVLTVNTNSDYPKQAMRLGAQDYLGQTDIKQDEFVTAIENAINRDAPIRKLMKMSNQQLQKIEQLESELQNIKQHREA